MSLKEFREGFKRWVRFPSTKLDYYTFRRLRALKSRDVGQAGWDEWFKYITRDIKLEPTIHERIQEGTRTTLLEQWMCNYAENLINIRYGDEAKFIYPSDYRQRTLIDLMVPTPVLEGEDGFEDTKEVLGQKPSYGYLGTTKCKFPPPGTAVVVGRGPSLFQHGHLQMLAKAIQDGSYKGMVIASDGGLLPCLEAGVVPHVVITVDGAPVIKKWFDHPLVEKHGKLMKWVASVTVNREVYQTARRNGLETYWFNPMFDDWRQNESWTRLQRLLSRTEQNMRGINAMNSGGNSGSAAWILGMSVFKRAPIALIGIDFGYPEGTNLENTQYFSSALKIANGDLNLLRKSYPKFHHPDFGTDAFVDMIFYHYRQAFIEMQQTTPLWYHLAGGTVNATEGGTLFGPNITCEPFAKFLEEHKT